MTNTALPIDASSGSPAYTSQQFRQAMSGLVANGTTRPVGGRSGYGPGHQPTVLTATTTLATIGPFSAIVDPAFTTTQGAYFISADANNTASITAAPSSPNTRIDLLYAQVNDTAIDSSGSRNFTVGIQTGTSGNPGLTPSLPARSFLLATINVPSSPGTPTITVNNTFSGAAGGLIPVPTAAGLLAATAITNPYDGMPAYAQDTNNPYIYDGSAWRPGGQSPMVWNHIGSLGSVFGSSCTDNDGSETTQYRVAFGKDVLGFVHMRGVLHCSASQSATFAVLNLPSGWRPLKQHTPAITVLNSAATAVVACPIQQNPNGDWIITQAIATGFYIFFDGIIFEPDGS